MNPAELDFQGRLKYEQLEFFFRRHWVCFLKCLMEALLIFLLVLILFVPTWILVNRFEHDLIKAIIAFFYIIVSFLAFNLASILVMNHFFDLIIVTDCRMIIVQKTLYLRNDHDTIDLTKIQDIAVEAHGLICNYLHYGKLVIVLSSGNMPIVLHYTPFPHDVLERANRIKRLHIIHRQEKRKPLSSDHKGDTLGMIS